MSRSRKNRDLAAIDGKRFSMDGALTVLSVVLLLIVVVIPVASIIYNSRATLIPSCSSDSSPTPGTSRPCGTPSRLPFG